MIEANVSVVASKRYQFFAVPGRLGENPASGGDFRKQFAAPVKMVKVLIGTSDEYAVISSKCLGIYPVRSGAFPASSSGLRIEATKHSVETSDEYR